ncbi:MAG TPA: type II toxin-antitoxin system VapC family toxin [bacterium]|nr:type II toxin-antitoxin system VapC family toxin [bacterium]
MIIVDTDILAYYLIQGERTDQAQQLKNIDQDWRAPQLWRAEFVSVVNKQLKSKRITLAQAHEILAAASSIYNGIDMVVDMSEVLDVASATGASTYDAHFLALAHRSGKPLVTGEKRHPGASHRWAVNIDDFLASKRMV